MNLDHLKGHGYTCPNVTAQDKHWLGVKWVEWYIDKRVKKTTGIVQLPPKLIQLEIEIKIPSAEPRKKKRRKLKR